jgi:hypothetical protein
MIGSSDNAFGVIVDDFLNSCLFLDDESILPPPIDVPVDIVEPQSFSRIFVIS